MASLLGAGFCPFSLFFTDPNTDGEPVEDALASLFPIF
jgi:hypothetical protein